MGEDEVSYTVTPGHSSWGNRFRFIDDRGRVSVFKIASRNLTCLMQYTCREAIFKAMTKQERFAELSKLYDSKCMTLAEYEEYCDLGYELSLED